MKTHHSCHSMFSISVANMPDAELADLIKSVHYNKAKAKHLVQASKLLLQRHKGRVPRTHASLIRLPGVGETLAELLVLVLNSKAKAKSAA